MHPLTKDDAIHLLDAYIDGELSREEHNAVGELLECEPDLRRQLEARRRVNDMLRVAYVAQQEPPVGEVAALRLRILDRIESSAASWSPAPWLRLLLRPATAVVACLFLITAVGSVHLVRWQQYTTLERQLLASLPQDWYYNDHLRTDNMVREGKSCPEEALLACLDSNTAALDTLRALSAEDYRFVVGRVCNSAGEGRTAHLVYAKEGGRPISVYVRLDEDIMDMPGDTPIKPPVYAQRQEGDLMAAGIGKWRFVVVGENGTRQNQAFFQGLVRDMRSVVG